MEGAVAVLDEEGVEGLNMRRLGKQLDTTAPALYWHVKNKDDVVALAIDAVWAEVELPDSEGPWRESATALASSGYAMIVGHPWMVTAMSTTAGYGPGKARHDDCCIAVYRKAGFAGEEIDLAMNTVFSFLLGHAVGPASEKALRRKLDRTGNAEEELKVLLTSAAEVAEGFPRLSEHLESFEAETFHAQPDGGFRWGLERVLDGLEERLRKP